jgi:hypothetical protein
MLSPLIFPFNYPFLSQGVGPYGQFSPYTPAPTTLCIFCNHSLLAQTMSQPRVTGPSCNSYRRTSAGLALDSLFGSWLCCSVPWLELFPTQRFGELVKPANKMTAHLRMACLIQPGDSKTRGSQVAWWRWSWQYETARIWGGGHKDRAPVLLACVRAICLFWAWCLWTSYITVLACTEGVLGESSS